MLKQILEQKGYDVSQTNIIPFTYEEGGLIKTGSFLVGSDELGGTVSMYPIADIGMGQSNALVFKPKETSSREEIVLEDQQALALIEKNALPLAKKNELLARAETARQRAIDDNSSFASRQTPDQNLNEFANSVRNILTSVDPNPGAIKNPYQIIDPRPTQEQSPPSVEQRQRRRNTQNQIPVPDETPTVQDRMDSSEDLLDLLTEGRSQEELEAQVAREFDIGNDQFLMELAGGQTQEQQEQVVSEQLDTVKVSDNDFDYDVNTSTKQITATRKSDGKVFENLQDNPEAKAVVDELVAQEREKKAEEAVKANQERAQKENKERLLAMAKAEEDFQQVREAAGQPPDTDPKMVQRKLPPITESQKTGLIFAGLAGLDIGLEAAKALGPARQEARQQIKELEALREQGRLGEDKAEDAETMRVMTRPIRAIAEQQERERQAVMAGMGQTRSAADLARLRRERDELIDQSLARAGAQVSAQRMQRAEQDLQKLQQLQQYRQSNIEALTDRVGRSAEGIAQGLGMSRAAQADTEGIEEFVNSYSQSLLEFGGATTEQEAKEKAVKEFYNKKPKDEDFLTKYITGLGS
jgi:hypothetical protein